MLDLLRRYEKDGDIWWVWHTWCTVDPLVIHTSKHQPVIDADGYWRGRFMPACMTRPVQVRAKSRSQAISLYKWAIEMYQDYRAGKAISGRDKS